MSNLDELFCHVDDWAQTFEPLFQKTTFIEWSWETYKSKKSLFKRIG